MTKEEILRQAEKRKGDRAYAWLVQEVRELNLPPNEYQETIKQLARLLKV